MWRRRILDFRPSVWFNLSHNLNIGNLGFGAVCYTWVLTNPIQPLEHSSAWIWNLGFGIRWEAVRISDLEHGVVGLGNQKFGQRLQQSGVTVTCMREVNAQASFFRWSYTNPCLSAQRFRKSSAHAFILTTQEPEIYWQTDEDIWKTNRESLKSRRREKKIRRGCGATTKRMAKERL